MQSPVSLVGRRSSCWTLIIGVFAIFGLTAHAAPIPKKDEPGKEETKKDDPKAIPALPKVPGVILLDLSGIFKKVQPGAGPIGPDEFRKEIEDFQKQHRLAMEEVIRAMQQGGFGGRGPLMAVPAPGRGRNIRGGNSMHEARMGAMIEVPNPTLIEQLDLPKEQGMIVNDVLAESAAAKAGIKPHDILMELNGKVVSSKLEEFTKQVEEIKPNTPVDAVVMRKGKKETIKGLSLPESSKDDPIPPKKQRGAR